jgi:hypothetical protein
MRVGMAGNSVMGTIHGATAQDVFERVVHDLGIHPSSFKATDVIAVAAPIRVRGGLGRVRRLVQITEVRKGWRKDPAAEGGFVDLFTRDYSRDEIEPTSTFLESELMGRLARKWAVTRTDLLRNLELRADIYRTLVRSAKKLGRQGLLEAEFVVRSNLVWRGFFERELSGRRVSYQRVYRRWLEWFENHARGE